jgi:hypothetical protein
MIVFLFVLLSFLLVLSCEYLLFVVVLFISLGIVIVFVSLVLFKIGTVIQERPFSKQNKIESSF